MNTLSTRGILLVLVLLVLAACGTGNRLDTDTNFGDLETPYDAYEGRGGGRNWCFVKAWLEVVCHWLRQC